MPIQDEASNAILDETGTPILDESESSGGGGSDNDYAGTWVCVLRLRRGR